MDLNEINSSKMTMFRNAVNSLADREIEELTAKIREQRFAADKLAKENEEKAVRSALRSERAAAEAYYRRELSRCDYEANKQVLAYRKQLTEDFFGKIEEELRAFAESAEYESFLRNRIKKAERTLGRKAVILVAPKDVRKAAALTECEVRADKSIILGGVFALDEEKSLFCDLSLDRALEEERAAFSDKRELMAAEL